MENLTENQATEIKENNVKTFVIKVTEYSDNSTNISYNIEGLSMIESIGVLDFVLAKIKKENLK